MGGYKNRLIMSQKNPIDIIGLYEHSEPNRRKVANEKIHVINKGVIRQMKVLESVYCTTKAM